MLFFSLCIWIRVTDSILIVAAFSSWSVKHRKHELTKIVVVVVFSLRLFFFYFYSFHATFYPFQLGRRLNTVRALRRGQIFKGTIFQKSALCVLKAVMELAESFASALNPRDVNRPKARMAWAAFCHRRLMRKLFNLSVLISLKFRLDCGVNFSQTCSRHCDAVIRLF